MHIVRCSLKRVWHRRYGHIDADYQCGPPTSIRYRRHLMETSSKKRMAGDTSLGLAKTSKIDSADSSMSPRLPLQINSKIPWNIRQSFLEKIWSLIQADGTNAKDEAYRIEKEHYEKYGTTASTYKNFAANYLIRAKDQNKQKVVEKFHNESPNLKALNTLIHSTDVLTKNKYIISTVDTHNLKESEELVYCERCHQEFNPIQYYELLDFERAKCRYHRGPKRNVQGMRIHSCCQNRVGDPGCLVADYHVFSIDSITLTHFQDVSTWPCLPSQLGIIAIDAEMIYTTLGMEVVRVSGVDWNLKTVIDLHCLPNGRIVDFNTFYSGITSDSLIDCKIKRDEMITELQRLIGPNTIIVGHSLENDLEALRIITDKIIDTSILFPHPTRSEAKLALRELVKQHLGIFIQEGSQGHDSIVDARSCMQLVQVYLKNNPVISI